MVLGLFDFGISYVLFGLILVLLALDIWTTHRFLRLGTGKEGNPIAVWLFKRIGFWPTVAVKVVGFLGFGIPLAFIWGFWFPLLVGAMLVGLFVYGNIKPAFLETPPD